MGPIFVTGAARSGKTLVRWMLSSHSRIAIARRAELWTEFGGRFGDLEHPANRERCVEAMLGRRQVAVLGIDPDRLLRDFAQGPGTYARLFALAHEQHASRCGKVRWGDQSARVERSAGDLLAAYPDARVIHLVRDPRDRHAALVERGPPRPGAAARTTTRWLSSVALARRNSRQFAGRYCILRYESLVGDPAATMQEVCRFLCESFEPLMLRMEAARRYDAERAAGDGIPISTAYVGRYRRSLRPREIALIQTAARGHMRALGYVPDRARAAPR